MGTTPTDAVTSVKQKFATESNKQGRVPKVPSMDAVGALLHMDIKPSGIELTWGSKYSSYQGLTSLKMADKIVRASVENAAKIKAAAAAKPPPIKEIPTDGVDLFAGTPGKVPRYLDQARLAFAQADLLHVLVPKPEPNRPTQTSTTGQQTSGFLQKGVTTTRHWRK